MFIGRKKELQLLQDSYERDGFSMTVITGRRRIGKSTLIHEFIKDKRSIYYTATRVGKERNLELLAKQVTAVLDPGYNGVRFQSVENLFDFMTQKMNDQKLIFVLDELPYWAEKDEALLSILQKYIDTQWSRKNLFIILCGSSLSFMENKVLSEKSPLFGRRNSQIRLQEFNYLEAAEFVPDYSFEDKAICYGVTGGVAKYLALFDPEKDLHENIKKLFFNTGGYLYDEPHNLLTQEFSDVTTVNNIIEQIAAGENTLSLISNKIHEKPNSVSYSINRLISVGIVEKKLCMGEEKNRKKVQYILRDSMFKFWYEFIAKSISIIEMDQGGRYYDLAVKPRLHDYMGDIFETMCRYYTFLRGTSGEWDFFLTNVGSWWGTELLSDEDGKRKLLPADVDVVATSDLDKVMVVGECKFRNEKLSRRVCDTLIRRSKSIPIKYRIVKYLLFSLSGFTGWESGADENEIERFTLSDLYSVHR